MKLGIATVAQKQAASEEDEKPKRKGRDAEPRAIALTIRGRTDWKGWVGRLADFERISVNELVDRALVKYAREVGFKEVAPER